MQTAERKKNKVKRMEEGNKEENFYPQFYKKLYQWYEKHLWSVRTVNVLYHLLPALAVLCYVDLLGFVYINGGRIMLLKVIAGVIMLVLAFLMGVVSVLGGVHFVKDVLAGAGIGVLIGIIGLFLI